MRIAPFEGSEAEHGNVQHIGFAGVDAGSLLWCDFCRDKVLFDSIGVDAVIYFRQFSLGTPAQLREFLLLKALELAGKKKFKLKTNNIEISKKRINYLQFKFKN